MDACVSSIWKKGSNRPGRAFDKWRSACRTIRRCGARSPRSPADAMQQAFFSEAAHDMRAGTAAPDTLRRLIGLLLLNVEQEERRSAGTS